MATKITLKPFIGGSPNTILSDRALRKLMNVDLFYIIMHGDPHEYNFFEIVIG